jgi:hypothetical protein
MGYELGILIVHGIGRHRQGDTLVRWGDALGRWLEDWTLRCDPALAVQFTSVRLHPADPEPAHGVLEITGEEGSARWLLAEAWWADDFSTPSYRQLAAWSIHALPITLLSLVFGAARRTQSRMKNGTWLSRIYFGAFFLLWIIGGLPLALVICPLLVGLLLTLLVVGLLPIPAVRSGVAATQRLLTGTVGDSLILLESPLQSAAMTGRVITGLDHLRAADCQKILVVAHSQGAAIVKRALAAPTEGAPIDTLITVGSGIKRLEELTSVKRGSRSAWLPSALILAAGVLGFWIWSQAQSGGIEWWQLASAFAEFIVGSVALGAVALLAQRVTSIGRTLNAVFTVLILALLAAVIAAGFFLLGDAYFPFSILALIMFFFAALVGNLLRKGEPEVTPDLADRTRRWLDLYSQADLVPNGATKTSKEGWPESKEVCNLDSVLRDHSYYVRAIDACLADIVTCVLAHSQGPLRFSDSEHELLRSAAAHRRWRVIWLRWTRWVVLVATAIFLLRHWPTIDNSTRAAYSSVFDVLPATLSWLPSPESLDSRSALTVGVMTVSATGGALYIAAAAIWGIWDRSAIHQLFLRKTAAERPWHLHVLAAFWGLVAIFAFRGDVWLSDLTDQGWSWSDQAWSILWLLWTLFFWTWPVLWLVTRTGVYNRVTERAVRNQT